MTTLREAAQQALEAMGSVGADWICEASHHAERDQHKIGEPCPLQQRWHVAYQALRAALAEPVQEPVAWSFEARHIDTAFGPAVSIRHPGREHKYMRNVKPLYTAPPQRKPLTKEQLLYIYNQLPNWGMDMDRLPQGLEKFARAIERTHGIT